MNSYIIGEVRKIIFRGDSGYVVGLLKVKESSSDLNMYDSKTITFTGYFHELNENDNYKLYGDFINHDKYGRQFQTESFERIIPKEKDSIVEFLTSGLFKGIGEVKAKKIVDVLGKNTLDTILNNPDNLILIPGITKKNIEELHIKLKEYESSYTTIIKLSNLGFTSKEAMLIYNFYKDRALEKTADNLYNIYKDVLQIGFKRVDLVALKNNTPKDDIKRVEAVIIYIIRELEMVYGHSYYHFSEIDPFVTKVLGVNISNDLLKSALDNLIKSNDIVQVDDCYYSREMYDAEVNIVNRVNILLHTHDDVVKNIDKKIDEIKKKFDIIYNEEQLEAIKSSCLKHFMVITGGPGTGKTTIMKGILSLYRKLNKGKSNLDERIALLAPTGRAAKRMSETTGFKASTIHRFLKWNKDTNRFQVNEYNKSNAEFVIIDEASMIDVYLFSNLLKGLRVNTKIVLVGDVFQLPSVGPGEVLLDFIESNKVNVCKLNQLYRQEENSNIINLAYDIKNNTLDNNIFNKKSDLEFIYCDNSSVIDKIGEICNKYKEYSYKDFQILAPIYKTLNGIDIINDKVEDIFNPKSSRKKEIYISGVLYREDDKVIQLTNMPESNVYNGDIGIIDRIVLTPSKEVYINYYGNIVKYTPSNFLNFKKAFAISIHKSQGSEFDIVVIPMVKNYGKMLYKKLIYTAVTRSKKKLYLVGDFEALKLAVMNDNYNTRRTSIKKFLIEGIK